MHVVLKTDRLLLRQFTSADVDDLVELEGDPEVRRFTHGKPPSREAIERRRLPRILSMYQCLNGLGPVAVCELSTGSFLGYIDLELPKEGRSPDSIEIGWRFRRSAWGHGYATEAACKMIQMIFDELPVQQVFAQTMAVNRASRRVMEKCGMRFVRALHKAWEDHVTGSEFGEVEYAIDRPREV